MSRIALGLALLAGTTVPALSAPPADFVRTDGDRFLLAGQPFHHLGADCYYLMTVAADPARRPRVDAVLREAAAQGLSSIRTWAFNDGNGPDALQTAPGVYEERVFGGLDYVIQECDSLGLRVVLPLVNNWVDYGGMDQYVAWSPTATRHDDFYTDPDCRRWYRDFAAAVLARYAGNPTILAWELANEPRCASDPSGDTLQGWIEEMSAYLKSLDPDHLVATGSEGFLAGTSGSWWLDGSEGVDYLRNQTPAAVDFAVGHSWPDAWGLTDDQALDLLGRQLDGALALGKPFVIEEFGKPRDGVSARAPAHYDPATYFSPGERPYAVPGAEPVRVDPARRAVVYSAPASAPAAGPATTAARDVFYSAVMDLTFSRGGDAAYFWALYDAAQPDVDGYGVYLPEDASTAAVLTEFVNATRSLNRGTNPFAATTAVRLGILTPNPFRGEVSIPVIVDLGGARAPVTVTVVDVSGRLVQPLWNGFLAVGETDLSWAGRTVSGAPAASGVYFIRLRTPAVQVVRQVVRLR